MHKRPEDGKRTAQRRGRFILIHGKHILFAPLHHLTPAFAFRGKMIRKQVIHVDEKTYYGSVPMFPACALRVSFLACLEECFASVRCQCTVYDVVSRQTVLTPTCLAWSRADGAVLPRKDPLFDATRFASRAAHPRHLSVHLVSASRGRWVSQRQKQSRQSMGCRSQADDPCEDAAGPLSTSTPECFLPKRARETDRRRAHPECCLVSAS